MMCDKCWEEVEVCLRKPKKKGKEKELVIA